MSSSVPMRASITSRSLIWRSSRTNAKFTACRISCWCMAIRSCGFAHLGMPHPEHNHDWLFRTANLMNIPHEAPVETPPMENTEFDDAMTLKEEIEKWR